MPVSTTTTKSTQKLWKVDCAPECGFSVRTHAEKELIDIVNVHLRLTHPGTTKSTNEIKSMIKPA